MKKNQQKRRMKGPLRKDDPNSKPTTAPISEAEAVQEERETRQRPYQTISRRDSERNREDKIGIMRYIHISIQFLRESRMELKKVKWPTRKELLASTTIVLFLVLLVSLFLGLIDFGLTTIIKGIIG